jgi:lipopolysaccharide/colanic/teichoic acid biosynthesis glycosyltransferase
VKKAMSNPTHDPFVASSLEKSATDPKEKVLNVRKTALPDAPSAARPASSQSNSVLDEQSFHRMIALERKRTERSRKPFVLMLLDAGNFLPSDKNGRVLTNLLSALSLSTRETDVTGWYKDQCIVGVMFTEIGSGDRGSILSTMMSRVSETLRNNLSLKSFSQISISMHVFPEEWDQETVQGNPTLYPDLARRNKAEKIVRSTKRMMDIVASAAALVLFAPLFFLVAVLVKLSSRGPVFFKQERLGQFGKEFTFLKFRSMYANNDNRIHADFMKRVINGEHDGKSDDGGEPVYKMINDPRITRVGRFLRRTSLDELPQFFNVLRGDMSLVGPRPPLAYECQEYDLWHRRRVLEVKPGVTGLWQVRGRSRVRFDDMVRLDLQYVRNWSLWLDIQILMQTPKAVLFGGDAY